MDSYLFLQRDDQYVGFRHAIVVGHASLCLHTHDELSVDVVMSQAYYVIAGQFTGCCEGMFSQVYLVPPHQCRRME